MKTKLFFTILALAEILSLVKAENNGKHTSPHLNVSSPTCTLMTSPTSSPYYCPSVEGTAGESPSGGTPPYTFLWLPGGETTATITGLSVGNYTVTVYDQAGCSGSNTITISTDSFSLVLAASQDTILVGQQTNLTATGGVSYIWSPSTGLTCTNCANPTASPFTTTTYTCVETNPCGTDTGTITIYVNPFCLNTYNEPICIATIDTSNNKCEVIWGRTNSPPDTTNSSYNIYRDSSSYYVLIQNQHLNNLSEYVDLNSNPTAGPVSYELSTIDSCGESALSPPHTTIFLTTTSALNVYILNWTAYAGFTPALYRIFRGPALNAMVQIDSVPNTVLTYHDTLPPLGSYYAVEAVNPAGTCIPTTKIRTRSAESVNLSGSFSNGFNTGVLTGTKQWSVVSGQWSVYPNPNNGVFTIAGTQNFVSGQWSVGVYNELGQRVYNEIGSGKINEQINLSNLADGIYTLRLTTETGIIVQKIVKIK